MVLKKNLALSETGFLFNPGNGDSFSLNPIALEVVEMLKAGKDEAAIRAALFAAYTVDTDTLEKDLYDFLNRLRQYKLLHEA